MFSPHFYPGIFSDGCLERAGENTVLKDELQSCISSIIMCGTPKNKIHQCVIFVYLPGLGTHIPNIGLYAADEVTQLLAITEETSQINSP